MVRHAITLYSKVTERLENEISLDGIGLEVLRSIFPTSGDDEQLSLVYPVSLVQKHELERLTGRVIDSSRYEIFLEAYSS